MAIRINNWNNFIKNYTYLNTDVWCSRRRTKSMTTMFVFYKTYVMKSKRFHWSVDWDICFHLCLQYVYIVVCLIFGLYGAIRKCSLSHFSPTFNIFFICFPFDLWKFQCRFCLIIIVPTYHAKSNKWNSMIWLLLITVKTGMQLVSFVHRYIFLN